MILKMVDERQNDIIIIKVDLNDKMYLVIPNIINHEFEYMRPRLMDVRKQYMNQYLNNPHEYQKCRNELLITMLNILETEIENLKETKDKKYFIA